MGTRYLPQIQPMGVMMSNIAYALVMIVSLVAISIYNAWLYHIAWNLAMPPVFGWPTVTTLQAYVFTFALNVLWANYKSKDDVSEVEALVKVLINPLVVVGMASIISMLAK